MDKNNMEKRLGLTLQDLVVLVDILNVASTRNAFRVEEYAAVGELFQKLTAIIQASNNQIKTNADQDQSNNMNKQTEEN